MNGRIYDPTLGRFLQAEPFIQAPNNSQSFNRYSYVLNNPLSYTDPSGFFLKAVGKFIKKNWRTIASIGLGYLTFGLGTGFAALANISPGALIGWGAAAGAVSGFVSTGSLKGALQGAFSGALFGAIGGARLSGWEAFGVSGLAGGFLNEVQGGNFGHGFISAGIGAVSGGWFGKKAMNQVLGAAIAGGTVSKLTGGKFANGALTAAFAATLRADWKSDSAAAPLKNEFKESNRAALDNDLEALNYKVTRQKGFSSSDEAAEWLHKEALSLTTTHGAEVGAKIYEQANGSFYVGKVVTSYHTYFVSLTGSSWAGNANAMWHSHPSGTQQYTYRTFSQTDISSARFYKYSYMSNRTMYPTQNVLFRIPGGGGNTDRCTLIGSLPGISSC